TLYTATAAGLRAAGLGGERPCRVSPGSAQHSIACCEAAVALELRYPACRVAGEPELRRTATRGRPGAPGSAPLALCAVPLAGRVGPSTHRADLAVLPPNRGAPLAVEVELTVKAPRRLLAICTAWARSREVAGVLYLVTPPVRPALERALAAARAGSGIGVADLDDLLARSGAPFADAVTSAP
ncbi:MAG: hypothetical protein ACYDC2_03065, partial [Solirubrobacteraceae bacterium]